MGAATDFDLIGTTPNGELGAIYAPQGRLTLADGQVQEVRVQAAVNEVSRAFAADYGITLTSVTAGRARVAAGGSIREVRPRDVPRGDDVAEIRRLAGEGAPRRRGVHPSHASDVIFRHRRSSNKER